MNTNGNGNGNMVLFMKIAQILVPVFTTLTLFGVGYGLGQISRAREDVADLRERMAKVETRLEDVEDALASTY